ncbi:hypothetical protein EDD18DRAFT_1123453 [Armillaria luteobubalina]|uniref:Uncharacterized protein n=1 Tax=Armillaria luteobubalina TaxID=153913 RepID=A0AA39QNY2_9AGAR|nr:hypothetical protein EDD18DRAFT_1123453 [Armillaria luteobubalina]
MVSAVPSSFILTFSLTYNTATPTDVLSLDATIVAVNDALVYFEGKFEVHGTCVDVHSAATMARASTKLLERHLICRDNIAALQSDVSLTTMVYAWKKKE